MKEKASSPAMTRDRVEDEIRATRAEALQEKIIEYVDLETAYEFTRALSPFGDYFRDTSPPGGTLFRGVEMVEHELIPSALRTTSPLESLCAKASSQNASLDPAHRQLHLPARSRQYYHGR